MPPPATGSPPAGRPAAKVPARSHHHMRPPDRRRSPVPAPNPEPTRRCACHAPARHCAAPCGARRMSQTAANLNIHLHCLVLDGARAKLSGVRARRRDPGLVSQLRQRAGCCPGGHLRRRPLDQPHRRPPDDATLGPEGRRVDLRPHLWHRRHVDLSAGRGKRSGGEYRTLKLYGQERNLITSSIARMNLFLHGVEDFEIIRGDTLADPKHIEGDRLRQFDVILASPPYFIKQWNREAWSSRQVGSQFAGYAAAGASRLCVPAAHPYQPHRQGALRRALATWRAVPQRRTDHARQDGRA